MNVSKDCRCSRLSHHSVSSHSPLATGIAVAVTVMACSSSDKTSAGTSSTGGSSGCTGKYETVQSATGLCIAKMATISAPSGSTDYSIDVTEVTQGQYDAWLATNPLLPESADTNCGWKTSYAVQGTISPGKDPDHRPVVYVDWCDAYAYCTGVGERLCGAIDGGSADYAS